MFVLKNVDREGGDGNVKKFGLSLHDMAVAVQVMIHSQAF